LLETKEEKRRKLCVTKRPADGWRRSMLRSQMSPQREFVRGEGPPSNTKVKVLQNRERGCWAAGLSRQAAKNRLMGSVVIVGKEPAVY
jgi:hypothetical protein